MDLYSDGEWKCGDDSKKFKRLQEKERVFEFLDGLNPDLDEVRGRVLSKEPLPAIREDLCTGKKIGNAKEVDGLYYLEEEPEALSNLSLVDKIVSQVPICSPQNLPPSNNNQQEEQDCSSPQKQPNPSDDQQVPSQIQPSTTQNLEDAQKPKVYSQRNKTVCTSPDCQNSESNIELLEDTGIVQSESKLHLNSLPSFHLDLDLHIAHIKSVGTCTKHPISKFVSYHRLSPSFKAFATNLSSVTTPRTVQDALANPKWREAICEELRALYKNRTCALADLPSGKRTVGCKWVFMVKHKADGSIERFKVGLVAKEYTQTYGIDYRKTFAPVTKINSFRVLLSLATNLKWPLQQLNV
ncbi:hypothetical protein WN943_026809 [Citrus x changshan-huyou]